MGPERLVSAREESISSCPLSLREGLLSVHVEVESCQYIGDKEGRMDGKLEFHMTV